MVSGDLTSTIGDHNKKAAIFDGVNDRITLPASSATFFNAQKFTITMWIKAVNYNQAGILFEKTKVATKNTQLTVFLFNNSNFYFRTVNSAGTLDDLNETNANLGMTNNTWVHIACRYDGATKKIFINAVDKKSKVYTEVMAEGPTGVSQIGIAADLDGPYKGAMRDLRFYRKALTQAEITQVYEGNMQPTKISARFMFDEDFNDSINGITGTNVGDGAYITTQTGNHREVEADMNTLTVSAEKWGAFCIPIQGRDSRFHIIGITRTA